MKTVLLVTFMLSTLSLRLLAQDTVPGHVIVEGYAAETPSSFDPLLSVHPLAAQVQAFIFPRLIGVEPASGSFAEKQRGALAESWQISDDGLRYTIFLRRDMWWNDGEAINADDVTFAWEAISGDQFLSPLDYLTDRIANVRATNEYQLEIDLFEADCDGLHDIAMLAPYPSHIAPADLSTLADQSFNVSPSVSSGVYNFGRVTPDGEIMLENNPLYTDFTLGRNNNEAYILRQFRNASALVDAFLMGDLQIIDNPPEPRRAEIYAAEESGDVKIFTYPGRNWEYISFNLADPDHPRNGLDEESRPIEQGTHPLFGSSSIGKDVRRALNLALDVDKILERATFGESTRMASYMPPSSWAYDENLPMTPFDPELAAQMLDAAGWPNSNPGDPTSIRICASCRTAPDGTEFRFNLMVNAGNARRAAVASIAKENWAAVGVDAEVQLTEFLTMGQILDSQTWDAAISGWRDAYPARPDATQILTPAGDVVGAGSNDGSYVNARLTQLNQQARTLPNCDPEVRKNLYAEAQRIVQDDSPYIFLYALKGFYAARSAVAGFAPYPNQLRWNVDTWTLRQDS